MPVTVTAVNPTALPVDGGREIVITGTDFLADAAVTFGGTPSPTVRVDSGTQITAVAPPRARGGMVDVVVTNPNGTNGTGASIFEYCPVVTKIEPAEGTRGGDTDVEITGKGFPVGADVHIGPNALGAVNVHSATRITGRTAATAPGVEQVGVYNPVPGSLGVGLRDGFRFCAPSVTGIEPTAIPAAGNVAITIRGDFFHANSTVSFGATPAVGAITFNSPQEIVATAPAGNVGRVDVEVTVAGSAGTLANGLTYLGAEIEALDVTRGPATGGTDITITGQRFDTANPVVVRLGGVLVDALDVVDATTITARTRAAGPGKVDLTVQNQGQPVVTKVAAFEMVAAPTIEEVSPGRGGLPGGTEITIRGTNFAPNATVRVADQPAEEVKVVSSTVITARTPGHAAGTTPVEVTNPGAPAVRRDAGFVYSKVDRVSPARGIPAGNEAVVIHGQGFIGEVTVRFGDDEAAAVNVDSETQLTVTTPAHAAGTVDVVVTIQDQAVTLDDGFTFSPITSVEPAGGPIAGGTVVTIRGAGFPDDPRVRFGVHQVMPVQRISAQELQVTTPGVVAGPVGVRVDQGDFDVTAEAAFTFRPVATVTAIEPAHGVVAGGTEVTITGTGFVDGATVAIGGRLATRVEVHSKTTITALTGVGPGAVPPRPAYDVEVTNPGDVAVTGAGLFRYRDPPAITAVEPAQGPVTGNRWITVTGRDFVDGAAVLIAGAPAAQTIFADAQTLYARVPAHAAGAVDVAVVNPAEPAGPTSAGAFTYVTTPAETGDNQVQFLLDGEEYFEELRLRFEEVRQAAPHELTYIRLAYWMIEDSTTLGDRTCFEDPGHRLLSYIDRVIRAGHDVDIIVWCPAKQHRKGLGAEMAEVNSKFGEAVRAVDQAAAAAGPHVGRARVFLEAYEGEIGASNHQKIAIFSIEGVRTVYVGGLNLSNHYFALADHSGGYTWHDAAVRLRGPVTDDVEAEWMRRWARTSEVADYWSWSAWGVGSQVLARDFSYAVDQTVRNRAIRVSENTTRQPPQADDRTVKIALTRSVGKTRHRWIRDEIIARINAATQYIYFENYHFADPELVRAVIARHEARRLAGATLRVVILVPMQGGACAYMTRRAWLHMLLRFRTLANAPMWRRVWYDLGPGEVHIDVGDCAFFQVNDTYNAAKPWTATKRWIDDDNFTFRRTGVVGAQNIVVPLDKITRVDGDFHFYTCRNSAHQTIYKHGKIAIFDDRYLVCGTSNWSFRSMQYDGEIAAITDSAAVAPAALQRLLDHFNPPRGPLAPLTPANIHVEALANLRALAGMDVPRMGHLGAGWMLVPMNHHLVHPHVALAPDKPPIAEAPNFTWF